METENTQETFWNSAARGWVEAQSMLDVVMEPFERLLVDAVSGPRVLDVGCGTGGTTLAVARSLGAEGRCVGVDISEPMVAASRERAGRDGARVEFILADAATHDFEPGSFDTIVSRFGVMFFDDPASAFANLRAAAADGGTLFSIAWRDPAENDFMTQAERAARPLMPDLPERVPGAPGQFAFADRERVAAILEKSGWAGINIQPLDVDCVFPEDQLVMYVTRLGPAGRALAEVEEPRRTQIVETVLASFAPYVHEGEVRFTAACWGIGAVAERG